MKEWQIGISRIDHDTEIDWQDDYVLADTREEAERIATDKGYYRNLRVRQSR